MKCKKVLAVLLAGVMAISVFGCGGKPDDSLNSSSGAEEGAENAEEDIYEVVMQVVTLGSEPAGLQEVEDAINEICEPEIGVHATLYPVSMSDLNSQTNLMITSGDKIDLLSVFLSGVGGYVSKGAVLPLDDLYEKYGQDIEAAEGVAMAGGYFDGKLYAIPSEEKMARSYGFMARTDIVEELGFEFSEDKLYTLDDVEELFKAYKEKYGDGNYCIAGTASNTEYFNYTKAIDCLGSTIATGVLMGAGLDDDTTVQNLYETDEYKEYAERMYRWAQEGYYSKDASTNTDASTVQIQSGHYLGGFAETETDSKSNYSRDNGYDMTIINLVAPYAATQMYQTSMWSISSTCENPEKTFQFLNLLYADNELDNILTYGLEGTSYQVIEKGEKANQAILNYADGVDAANTPYNMPLHIYGDKLSIGVFEPLTLDYYKVAEEFNASITDDMKSRTLGYVFNSDSVSTQKTAVDALVQQYSGIITTGAQDPATVLPEFQKALKDAGVDDIIKENQAQLDTWLAENE